MNQSGWLPARVQHGWLADRLVPVIVVSAAAGALLPDFGGLVGVGSLVWLALLVFGVGITLRLQDLVETLRRPGLMLVAVVLPWVCLVGLGAGAQRFLPGSTGAGFLAVASAPTEVSAVLLATIAGGDAALVTTTVAASLLLSPIAIPVAFAVAGVAVSIPAESLVMELGVGVAAPLVLALVVPRFLGNATAERWSAYGGDMGTLAIGLIRREGNL